MKEEEANINQLICDLALHSSQKAFKALYIAYYDKLLRFVSIYIDQSFEAEEIVSDTFMCIWESRKSLTDVSNINAFIYMIARHKAISYYRKQHMEMVSLDDIRIDLFKDTVTNPEDNFIHQEEIRQLNCAIESLPTKCKEAFKLVREDKLKYKEVAEIMNISIKTLETHLGTAIKKLRSTLGEMKKK